MIEPEEVVFCKLRGRHVIRAATMSEMNHADAKCKVCGLWYVNDEWGLNWVIEAEDGTTIT